MSVNSCADVLGGEGVRVPTSILPAGGLVVGAEGTLLRFLSPNTGRGVRLRRVNSYKQQTTKNEVTAQQHTEGQHRHAGSSFC